MFIYFFEGRIAGYATTNKKETDIFEYKKAAKRTVCIRKYF